jgi:hypothetical protein
MKTTRCHPGPGRPGSLARLLAVTVALAAAGCGGSDSTSPYTGPTGNFKGTLVGESGSGVLTLSFPASAAIRSASPARFAFVREAEAASGPVTVTGTLALTGGSVIQLTGTYNASGNPQLVLAGSGYGLAGNYTATNGVFSGTSTFPDGKTGLWTVSADAATVYVFCGTYSSTEGNGGGTWNVVIDKNNNLTGVATGAGQLQGTLDSGGNVSVMYTGGTATGTLDRTTGGGSGSYDAPGIGQGDAGNWTANTGGC